MIFCACYGMFVEEWVLRMMAGLKQWMKNELLGWQQRKYYRLLEKKTVTYDSWIKRVEKEKYGDGSSERAVSVRKISYEICEEYLKSGAMREDGADVVLFVGENGVLSEIAEGVVVDFFGRYEGVVMAYGDEDVMGPEGVRYTPWFKPHWSPDTFLSFFYFGNVFAVRMEALCALTEEEMQWIWQAGEDGVYRLCYVIAVKSGGFAVRDGDENGYAENGEEFGFPVGHMDEVLFHGRGNCELEMVRSLELDRSGCPVLGKEDMECGQQRGMISIVIPSKDNAEILKRCIRSVQEQYGKRKGKLDCEIIVVDNGSEEEVRADLVKWLDRQEKMGSREGIHYLYLYEKMPFHFSKMCNMGAEAAASDVLLFLNDDVEMAGERAGGQDSLLERLYDKAKCDYIGAVGVKLYYPDSRRMQHAGIVNLRLGPVHKLQFKEDDTDYYYGWNRRERNVIAVTGACLAVEKKKYVEAGGFPMELPVAFNDVDFCFTLFERGYYNVVLQEVVLYHYESMSRGNDDDREKLERLLGEKDRLYARHPNLYGTDPFYHKYLAGDMLSTGFELKADYDEKPQSASGQVRMERDLVGSAREDACVMVSLEYAGTMGGFLVDGAGEKAGMEKNCMEKRDGAGNQGVVGKQGDVGKQSGAGKQGVVGKQGDIGKQNGAGNQDSEGEQNGAGNQDSGGEQSGIGKQDSEGKKGSMGRKDCVEKRNGAGTADNGKDRGYLLQGYSFVTGSDNACFEKYLIFEPEMTAGNGGKRKEEKAGRADNASNVRLNGSNGGRVLSVKAEPFIRRDVEANLPDQINVGMTGFCMFIGKGDLPLGTYRVGVMAKDKCSGQKLYSWTNRYLKVEG